MENPDCKEPSIAVLESKVDTFEQVFNRLDRAIEKITEVNNNVSRMLAVHEERISKQEDIDAVLFDKIDKLRDKMDLDHDSVNKRLSLLERKLWTAIGALGALMIVLNPASVKQIMPLLKAADSAIVQPAYAVVNGLR